LTLYYSISCIKWEIVKYINTYVLVYSWLVCAQCNGHDPFFLSGDIWNWLKRGPLQANSPKRGVFESIWHMLVHCIIVDYYTHLYSYLTLYYSISCIKWENGDIYNTYVLILLWWACAQCNGHDPFFLSGDIWNR